MKNHVLLLALLSIIICGCNREEPLPELGVEGVYMMARMENGEVLQGSDLPYENVYWFFGDRTFRKARLIDAELVEASGTFSPVPHPGGDGAVGQAYELIYTVGEELIEGCDMNREILIQTSPIELLHDGAPCGEPTIYYNKANFGGE